MYTDFLRDAVVADGVDRVAAHAEGYGLLPICETTVAVSQRTQALLIGFDQPSLLYMQQIIDLNQGPIVHYGY